MKQFCESCSTECDWLECGTCKFCGENFCLACYDAHECPFESPVDPTLLPRAEELLGLPAHRWAGHCYEIACEFVKHKLVEGKPRYGHWLGPVDPGSLFDGRSIVQHGWIEMLGGKICDPTRWVFEGVKPYIFIGPSLGLYDIGGNTYRAREYVPTKVQELTGGGKGVKAPKDKKLRAVIQGLTQYKKWNRNLAYHLAVAPPQLLQPYTKAVYEWLNTEGMRGLIPVDNWEWIVNG